MSYYKRNLVIDPLCMTELWLEQLTELLEIPLSDITPEEAFDAVVLYGRLLRTNQTLILQAGTDTEWRTINKFFDAHLPALLRASRDVLKPSQWIVEAAEFVESDLTDLEETVWAERLVSDVDDMQIYAYFSPSPELDVALATAYKFLLDNRDIACCCAIFTQTVAATFPHDICESNFELGLTGELYGQLLDILEVSSCQ